MAKSETNPKVDAYITRAKKWQHEFELLRNIAVETGLTEEFKWGHPCYALDGANVFLIHGFKEYCALLFFKGALMKDPKGILIQQTENVQSARQVRFTNLAQIAKMKTTIKAYMKNAVEVEKSGAKVELKKVAEYKMPDEFKQVLDKKPAIKKAFYALTPGRQRAYLLFFSQAKQSATRSARIQKYLKHIQSGKGLND